MESPANLQPPADEDEEAINPDWAALVDKDDDVDADLASLFGEDDDSDVPPSPEPRPGPSENEILPSQTFSSAGLDEPPPAAPRRGILERLVEKGHGNLSGRVAGIVRDAEDAIAASRNDAPHASPPAAKSQNAPTPPPARAGIPSEFAELMRKRRQRTSDAPALSEKEIRKKARNAFTVVGKRVAAVADRQSFDDAKFSCMRLQKSLYDPSMLTNLFEMVTTVNIAEVPDKAVELMTGQIKGYAVFGCLVKKVSKKTAKNGKPYAVWTLSNMPLFVKGRPVHPLTAINLLVFDEAYLKLHTEIEGTVFALRSPRILPPRDTARMLAGDDGPRRRESHSAFSGHCLSVSKPAQVLRIAHAGHFGVCKEESRDGKVCGAWFHTGRSGVCHYHTKIKLQRQTATRRPVINTAERPGPTRDVFAAADPGTNVSRMDGPDFVGRRYRAGKVVKDDVQIMRERADAIRSDRLRAVTASIKKKARVAGRSDAADRPRLADLRRPAGRGSLPEAGGRTGFARIPVATAGGRRGVDAQDRFRRATRAVAGTAAAVRTSEPAAVPAKTTRKERVSAQERYDRARDTLLHLGFKLRKDGGFEPPTMQRRREQQIVVGGIGAGAGRRASAAAAASVELPKANSPAVAVLAKTSTPAVAAVVKTSSTAPMAVAAAQTSSAATGSGSVTKMSSSVPVAAAGGKANSTTPISAAAIKTGAPAPAAAAVVKTSTAVPASATAEKSSPVPSSAAVLKTSSPVPAPAATTGLRDSRKTIVDPVAPVAGPGDKKDRASSSSATVGNESADDDDSDCLTLVDDDEVPQPESVPVASVS